MSQGSERSRVGSLGTSWPPPLPPPRVGLRMKEISGLSSLLGSSKIEKEVVASTHSHGLLRYDLTVGESPSPAQSHGRLDPFFCLGTFQLKMLCALIHWIFTSILEGDKPYR